MNYTASDIQELLRKRVIINESMPTKVQQGNLTNLIRTSSTLYELAGRINKVASKTIGWHSHYMDLIALVERIKEMVPDLESCVEALKVDIQKLYEEE